MSRSLPELHAALCAGFAFTLEVVTVQVYCNVLEKYLGASVARAHSAKRAQLRRQQQHVAMLKVNTDVGRK